MPYPKKGEQRNTGRTQFKKGQPAWNKKEPFEQKCAICNKVFLIKPSYKDAILTCSKVCSSQLRKQLIGGEKSYLWKGGKPKCKDCNKQLASYSAKQCENCFHKRFQGKNHASWKGGITPENLKIRRSTETKLWRKSIFERDDFTCQKCKERGVNLVAHHILNFQQHPELRFAIDNGTTLCKGCHLIFHKDYGFRKNNFEQLNDFISRSITAD